MKEVIYTINSWGYDKINLFNKEKGFDYNTNWTFFPIPKYIKDANISIVKAKVYKIIFSSFF